MFHWIWVFIVGIVVGLIARWIMPGAQHMGWIMTGILGIAGSFVGGFIVRLFHKPANGSMVDPAGLVMSIVGAVVVLFLARVAGLA